MQKVHIDEIPWSDRESPKGTYRLSQKDISLALGGLKDIGEWGGGHPFDVALVRLPAGATNFPQHQHLAQWEFFAILSGRGTVRCGDDEHSVRAGDHFLQAPGVAHQIVNTGEEDLVYYVIANNPPVDVSYYPRTNKGMIKPWRKMFKLEEVDYYQGEE